MTETSTNTFHSSIREIGLQIAGVNTETRCLAMGLIGINGFEKAYGISDVHHKLVQSGATLLHPFQIAHTRNALLHTANDLFISRDEDTLKLNKSGLTSAGLGGILLRDYVNSPDTTGSLSSVTGFYKDGDNVETLPAPQVRLMVLRILQQAGLTGRPLAYFREGLVEPFGISESSIRRHLKALELNGNVENLGGKSARRALTGKGKKNVPKYLNIIDEFTQDKETRTEEGLEYLSRLFDDDTQKLKVGFYIKSAILGSGKSRAESCEGILEELNFMFQTRSAPAEGLTTTEIANILGVEVRRLGAILGKILNTSHLRAMCAFTATRVTGRGHSTERIWVLRSPENDELINQQLYKF